ncbi:MAG: hypothetical protein E7597_04740 [Ruminococcaceae bacterium]|nr:hypothetical protein [Oscillospiraceae bacterium]
MAREIKMFGTEAVSGDWIETAYNTLYYTSTFGDEVFTIPDGQHVPVYQGFGSSVLEHSILPSVEYKKYQGKDFAMPFMSYGDTPQTNAIRFITSIAIRLPNADMIVSAIENWEDSNYAKKIATAIEKSQISKGVSEDRITELTLFRYLKKQKISIPEYILDSGEDLWFLYPLSDAVPMYTGLATALQEAVDIFAAKLYGAIVGKKAEKVAQKMHTPLNRPVPIVGSVYKGKPVELYKCECGMRVDVNSFLAHLPKEQRFTYEKSKYSLEEAMELFPEWYHSRIVNKVPAGEKERGSWDWTGKGFFFWFHKQCLECENLTYGAPKALLAVAIKTNYKAGFETILSALADVYQVLNPKMPRWWCENKANELFETSKDPKVSEKLRRLKRKTLSEWSGVEMKANKRNGNTRKVHLEQLAKMKKEKFKTDPDYSNSRCGVVVRWREANPEGNKSQCARELKIDRKTVAKYWDAKIVNHRDGSKSIKGVKKRKESEKQKAKKKSKKESKKAATKRIHDSVLAMRRVPPKNRGYGVTSLLATVRGVGNNKSTNRYRLFSVRR